MEIAMGLSLKDVQMALDASFSRDTAGRPDQWSPKYPAYSHCGPATLVIRHFFGGEIRGISFNQEWSERLGYSGHQINVLCDKSVYDPTRLQFPPDFPYADLLSGKLGLGLPHDRTMLLMLDRSLMDRYERLKKKVMLLLLEKTPAA